jgi:hypothetical protein
MSTTHNKHWNVGTKEYWNVVSQMVFSLIQIEAKWQIDIKNSFITLSPLFQNSIIPLFQN